MGILGTFTSKAHTFKCLEDQMMFTPVKCSEMSHVLLRRAFSLPSCKLRIIRGLESLSRGGQGWQFGCEGMALNEGDIHEQSCRSSQQSRVARSRGLFASSMLAVNTIALFALDSLGGIPSWVKTAAALFLAF